MTQIRMEQSDWEEKYLPRRRHGNLLDADPRVGHVSYLEFKKAVKENRIWSLVEADDGSVFIENGNHIVNCLEKYICKVPYEIDDLIIVT